jgi:acetyltransferase
VGGVILDLEHAQAVSQAAQAILDRVAQARPDARVEGFTVQPMVRRPRALELIVGTHVDPQFGPIMLFGQGGTSVEVVADRAVGLPPLNDPLAQALINRTRVARLLQGWRDVPAADIDAVIGVITALSDLLAREARIAEIDINPLLADAQGVVALDARVRVSVGAPGGAQRFAIRPYPDELVRTVAWNGRTLTVRPIRPEDEAQHRAFIERLDAIDLRMRFFHSRRHIERSELARLTQIDYEREMAFIATAPSISTPAFASTDIGSAITADAPPSGAGATGTANALTEETLGVVRALCDPDNEQAEFAITVRSDLKGGGLGELLMRRLIEHLRERGIRRVVGDVLRDNQRMLQLAHDLGFQTDRSGADTDSIRVRLELGFERQSRRTRSSTLGAFPGISDPTHEQ